MADGALRKITILGATGSIGASTLDVIERHPDRFAVIALAAHRQWPALLERVARFRPPYAAMLDVAAARELESAVRREGLPTQVLAGSEGLREVATLAAADTVVAGIVGAAGLAPTLAAARAGKRILLANKETLVLAGAVFMAAVREGGAKLLPIDSEHSAIFQCLPSGHSDSPSRGGVRRILLTASGGPFLGAPADELAHVTPEQACAHPRWRMGRKISVDSATMMNKGLETIEAHWLFDVAPAQIEVLVHPESIVHSLVEYRDGSVLAQLGNPDMRTPIAHALAWPERIAAGVAPLDLAQIGALHFAAPDPERFPCLALARAALIAGGSAGATLNAANEVAVAAFLEGAIGFLDIAGLCAEALARLPARPLAVLDDALEADREGRAVARELLSRHAVSA
ncbi:MAG TPA: 1-deoxy-D-xylulose-5-phosphate reductoisomerase [Casimicrobiaceae bacterium]|jgi:1-deoxy-D-xylulose-5-phosphate reductoisomerase|nr:1-deoxy-D-xylulose-5-phosphate reductoisomerase [Casimicrobiaceae bacterium]